MSVREEFFSEDQRKKIECSFENIKNNPLFDFTHSINRDVCAVFVGGNPDYIGPDQTQRKTLPGGARQPEGSDAPFPPDTLSQRAIYGLYERTPALSARTVVTGRQAILLALVLAAGLATAAVAPGLALRAVVCLSAVGFSIGAATRVFLAACGLRGHPPPPSRSGDLPVYSVLVPLYREAGVLGELAAHLRRLDYPHDKLDVLFVVEEDDLETRRLAQTLSGGPFRTVVVPASQPRTKPKACNYALNFAVGEFLVIYDAEDRPDCDQLRKAVAAFRGAPDTVACLQARLAIDNAGAGFLPTLFALDYDIWFSALLPGLDRLCVPMPLGGTSNHFRASALRAAGAWDPFNVTEDADLGLRLARLGYRVRMLDSETREEAPYRFVDWLRQRTRWLKGYMQTLLVHAREPLGLWRRVGLRGVLAIQLFLGGAVVSALVNPLLWLILFTSTFAARRVGGDASGLLAAVSGGGLFLANVFLAAQTLAARRWGPRRGAALFGFGLILYWMLVSVAAWRALGQLIFRPFLWEKTPHGGARELAP